MRWPNRSLAVARGFAAKFVVGEVSDLDPYGAALHNKC
jgi:hypothetical protein